MFYGDGMGGPDGVWIKTPGPGRPPIVEYKSNICELSAAVASGKMPRDLPEDVLTWLNERWRDYQREYVNAATKV